MAIYIYIHIYTEIDMYMYMCIHILTYICMRKLSWLVIRKVMQDSDHQQYPLKAGASLVLWPKASVRFQGAHVRFWWVM